MNNRKLKLALTVNLVDLPVGQNLVERIKEIARQFTAELGSLVDQHRIATKILDQTFIKSTYDLKFEKATINVDLMTNRQTKSQYLQGFDLR